MTEAFFVTCVSCSGRLRVTDEGLIGTILSCPQCGSMVQIVAPENVGESQDASKPDVASSNALKPGDASKANDASQPGGAPRLVVGNESIDSQEMTQEDIWLGESTGVGESPIPGSSGAAPPGSPATPPHVESPNAVVTENARQVVPPRAMDDPPRAMDDPPRAMDESPRGVDESVAPPIESTMPVGERESLEPEMPLATPGGSRKVAQVVAGGLAGLLVVTLGLAWWNSRKNNETLPIEVVSGDLETRPIKALDPEPLAPDEAVVKPADTPPGVLPIPDQATQEPATTTESASADSAGVANGDSSNNETSPMIPSDLMPDNILGGPGLDIPGKDTAKDQATPGNRLPDKSLGGSDPMIDLPPELQRFTELLDLPGQSPEQVPQDAAPQPLEDFQVEQAADARLDPMLLATPPPEVNIKNAMKLRVALQTKGYPLSAFLLLVSETTGVPIQIDWVHLDMAGIDLSTPMTDPKPGWKPIGDLLRAVVDASNLTLESDENRVTVSVSIATLRQRIEDSLETDDFGDEAESAKKLIQRMLDATQWDEKEKLGLQSLVTDGLRVLRDIPARLPVAARQHWMDAPAVLTANDPNRLSKGPPPNLSAHWTPLTAGESGSPLDTAISLAGLLRRTSQFNRAACVINWEDARAMRLSPNQLTMPFMGQPAGAMLAEALRPMGLQVRRTRMGEANRIDHWWVGTQATYDRMPILVLGEALGPNREALLSQLKVASAKGETLMLLEHDPVSDRYLSLMPRFLYRQLPTILQSTKP